jgi:formate dehydrogenase beta subunit
VIVGGGNVAIDCARTCLRLGFKEVTIVYRRSRTEMPGSKEEIEAAEKEGVNIRFLTNPVKVLTEGDKVTGAQCVRMELGEPDASGRRRPIVVKGSEFFLPADVIIPAVGESPDLSFISKENIETNDGTVKIDSFCRTSREGVFSGGDCVIGPATLIEAIAAGNRAARGIDQYLTSGKVVQSEENTAEIITHELGLSPQKVKDIIARKSRQSGEQLPPSDRVRNFDEVEKCFSAEAAVKEAERCLRCYRVMLLALANEG